MQNHSIFTILLSPGVCMWEILSEGNKPFVELTNAEAASHISKGNRLHRPNNCSENLYSLMLECWAAEPEQRPKFHEIKPELR